MKLKNAMVEKYEETLDYNKERMLIQITSNDIHSNLKAFQFLIWKEKGRERAKATFLYPSSMYIHYYLFIDDKKIRLSQRTILKTGKLKAKTHI